jgi:hypothetical protein
VVTLAIILALAAPASADTLGPGTPPDVLVDRSGVAHVVYFRQIGTVTELHYRSRSPGGAWSADRILPTANSAASYGTLRILQETAPSARLLIFLAAGPGGAVSHDVLTSADGGRTWTTGTGTGVYGSNGNQPEVAVSPFGLYVISGLGGEASFNTVPLTFSAPGLPAAAVVVISKAEDCYLASCYVTTDAAGRPVFGWRDTAGNGFVRPGVGGPRLALGAAGGRIAVAGGPGGVVVLTGGTGIAARHIVGTRVSPLAVIEASGGSEPAVAADAGGGFHAAWITTQGAILSSASVDGTTWSPPAVVAGPPASGFVTGLRLSAAPGGGAEAVWINPITNVLVAVEAEAALPPPRLGRTANTQVLAGSPRVRMPGTRRFVPLRGGRQVPFGAEVDVSGPRDRLRITAAAVRGAAQAEVVYGGRFVLRQDRAGVVTQTLSGGSFAACGAAASAKRTRRVRRLWANARGRFRTRGRYSASTVRGTTWLVEDRCDGTLTRVTTGVVAVRDLVRKRTVLVRAGGSFLARKG